jgi:hypothetical protein
MSMLTNTLNPNMYVKWMMSPLDPRAMQLMTAPLNPNLYMGWMGASMNPASYGDMWKGFLAPTTAGWTMPTVAPTAYAAPAAAGTAPIMNPFDPNAWTQMLAPATQLLAPAAQGGYFPFPTAPAAALHLKV